MLYTKISSKIIFLILFTALYKSQFLPRLNRTSQYRDPLKEKIGRIVEMTIAIDGIELNNKLRIGLFDSVVPITADNFYQLCVHNYYDNTPFHRIIPDFMIQGGDFTRGDGTGGTAFRYNKGDPNKFEDENFLVRHAPHVLSMANAGPDTNGSQFFITLVNPTWLNGKHVVFARLINTQAVADSVTSTMESYGSGSGKTSKPVTLVKCEEITNDSVNQQNAPEVQQVAPPVIRESPPVRRVTPPVRRESPPVIRESPPIRRVTPPVIRESPPIRRVTPPVIRKSTPLRRVTPPAQRVSPPVRRTISPAKNNDAVQYTQTNNSDLHSIAVKKYELEKEERLRRKELEDAARNNIKPRKRVKRKLPKNIYMNDADIPEKKIRGMGRTAVRYNNNSRFKIKRPVMKLVN